MSEELRSQQEDPPCHPPNDSFATTRMLPAERSGKADGSNAGASAEPNEPWHRGYQPRKSVWYRWQSPQTDTLMVFLIAQSNFNSRLEVYTERMPGSDFSILAPAEPFACLPDAEVTVVAFQSRTGKAYRIAVDGLSNPPSASLDSASDMGDEGQFIMSWFAAGDSFDSIISGAVKYVNGVPKQDATLTVADSGAPPPPDPKNTDATGTYLFINLAPDDLPYVVTPSLANHYFHPASKRYEDPIQSWNENYTVYPQLTFSHIGTRRDRVNADSGASDGTLDQTFTLTFPPGNAGEVTELSLVRSGGGQWKTEIGSGFNFLGVSYGENDPLLNDSTGRVRFLVADDTIIHLFVSDDSAAFSSGDRFDLTITFSDGRKPTVTLTI